MILGKTLIDNTISMLAPHSLFIEKDATLQWIGLLDSKRNRRHRGLCFELERFLLSLRILCKKFYLKLTPAFNHIHKHKLSLIRTKYQSLFDLPLSISPPPIYEEDYLYFCDNETTEILIYISGLFGNIRVYFRYYYQSMFEEIYRQKLNSSNISTQKCILCGHSYRNLPNFKICLNPTCINKHYNKGSIKFSLSKIGI